jgi:hypothetical protein
MEGDVLICYLSIKEIPKINAIEIFNTVIIEGNSEQQNIMHFNVGGIKTPYFYRINIKRNVKI